MRFLPIGVIGLATALSVAACGGNDQTFVDASSVDGALTDGALTDGATDSDAAVDATAADAAEVDATDVDAGIDAPVADAAPDAPPVDAAPDAPPVDAAPDAPPVDAAPDAPPVLAGDLCSNAEPIVLTGGTATISATTAPYTNNYAPGVCAGVNSGGPDRVHSITVPAGQRLTASVVPTSGTFDPGIFVIGGPAAQCDAATISCLAANDNGGDGETDRVVYNNTSAAAVDVFIMIDGFRAVGNAYTLNVQLGAIPPPPPGDVCATASQIALTAGQATVSGTTVDFNNDYDPGPACTEYFTDGPDAVHAVTVPAAGTLTVTLTPAATYDAGVYLLAGPAAACTATPTCLDGADLAFGGEPETVTYTNSGGSAVEVMIVVDGALDLSTGDTYSLNVSVAVP